MSSELREKKERKEKKERSKKEKRREKREERDIREESESNCIRLVKNEKTRSCLPYKTLLQALITISATQRQRGN